ncbi:efflux RND transporter periplasmic adaptor subunit [Shinella sp. CPCC 101442]|uniref:efflux RND transporter periplasmic adaptor subunit n=1 Tax=Shinella sp. CPCC 101442 TaxID=2932265 RepID=UPI0021522CC6|nr:efflux RND transporter periplasmic adaptor subunit [Shinella sp. CPCC 101442]MCR6497957.1 efflux RND transporter periplasmic adaptor subunit [Shinella sp. CPCC 101442]
MTKTVRPKMDEKPADQAGHTNVTFMPGAVPPARRKRRSRAWFWLPVIAVLAGAGYYGWRAYAPAETSTAVITQAVMRGDIENAVTAVGTLEAVKSVDAGAQVSGQLKTLHVVIGDTVKKDQLLAEMDPATIENRIEINRAELANLQAQLDSKKAQLALKQANIARQRNLVAGNAAAKQALDQAIADLAAAEADVNATEAQIRKQQATLAGDEVDLGYTKIYAPMAGTVVSNPVKEGQTLNAVQSAPTIVTIADLSTMTVRAEVSEADVSRLKVGMEAYFTLLGQPGKRFTGTLRQIEPTPTVENNVVLYNALFDVPNPDGELMMSMSAQVFFVQAAARDVLLVPAGAVASKQDGAEVTVVTASGATEVRKVETGIRNRVSVEVKSGLAEGDKVVVTAGSAGDASARNSRRNNRMPPMF